MLQTTNVRPTASSIKPPTKMSVTEAPVFGKLPVDTLGCVPLAELDDVVAFGAALVSVVGVVALSDVVVSVEVGNSVDVGLGDEDALADVVVGVEVVDVGLGDEDTGGGLVVV